MPKAKKARFEMIVKKLSEVNPKAAHDEPSLEDIAVAVAMWALQHGHDKQSTIEAMELAFDAIEG